MRKICNKALSFIGYYDSGIDSSWIAKGCLYFSDTIHAHNSWSPVVAHAAAVWSGWNGRRVPRDVHNHRDWAPAPGYPDLLEMDQVLF